MDNNIFNFIINSTAASSFNQQSCLYLDALVNWDNFEQAATALASQIDATITNKDVAADIHRWQLDFEGVRLYLIFEDTSDSLWLELESKEDQETLDFIATMIEKAND